MSTEKLKVTFYADPDVAEWITKLCEPGTTSKTLNRILRSYFADNFGEPASTPDATQVAMLEIQLLRESQQRLQDQVDELTAAVREGVQKRLDQESKIKKKEPK